MSDKNQPLVTVVIASYNHRQYVEKAILSITTQSYQPLELIVIDDGSTDGSGELLEALQGKYDFRLIRKENSGLVSVINMAIWVAQGDYVVFHASDDESLPERISGQVNVLERYPNAAFVSGNVAFQTEDGRSKGTLLPGSGRERELGFDDLFLHGELVSSVASMYRAKALREMAKLSDAYLAEDPQIFLRLTNLGYSWVQWAGPPVITYRMLFTSQSRTRMLFLLRQNKKLIDEFSDNPNYNKATLRIHTSILSALAEEDKKAAFQELFKGKVGFFSKKFARVAVKLVLPRRWHYFFKRAGKPT